MSINVCNDRSMASITSLPSGVSGGSLVLLSEQTASSSANISFTSGIDSTYKEYIFKFINIHPATDTVSFQFNGSTDSGSNYNVTKTTSFFYAYHGESDTPASMNYEGALDLAQSTSFQPISDVIGNDNDQVGCGFLHLFNPSSTTFVKHFICTSNVLSHNDRSINSYVAGYFNTTSAINAVRFQVSSGNIDAGTIKMYGVV